MTSKDDMDEATPISFALVEARRLRLRLNAYRECVSRLAAGAVVDPRELTAAAGVLERLGLPGHALRADVRAAASMRRAACEHRRLELEILYPHLFERSDEWVDRRLAMIRERRAGRTTHMTGAVGAAGPAR